MGVSYRPKTNDYNVTYKKMGIQLRDQTCDFDEAVKMFEEFKAVLGEKSRRSKEDLIKPKNKTMINSLRKIKNLEIFDCSVIEGKEGERCNKSYRCENYNECLDQVFKKTKWPGWKEINNDNVLLQKTNLDQS